ncbi:hypothetical protein HanXRQr2_Chr17g0803601 [Helianthus annuus]|uniref:Uncharacterized protein n=1 Tax=Helianthus annuus TaxID=4232 RepID=A0A9K3DIX7_HELAN|nr:hypothetical protein HanXRQr2_Chr17g0803601 [Helianthus annuus]KAJ0813239.1 hypothetical protein HanPSC8_Chr17g0771171 [Helianthus annuus]
MGKQKLSAIYHKLDSTPKEKGTSSSKYPVNLEEGIFVRKANYENPLTLEKRNSILRKGQEKKKTQAKKVRFNPEVQELGNNPPWEDNLDEKWANLYMLATIAENANL